MQGIMQILCKLGLTRFSFFKLVIIVVTRFCYLSFCVAASVLTTIIVKKLNSLKHLVRTTVAELNN